MYLDHAQLRNSIAAKPHFRTACDNQECDVRRLLPLLFWVLPVNEGQEIVRQRLRMMCQIGLNRHFPLLIGRGECMCARPSIFCFGDSFLESRFPLTTCISVAPCVAVFKGYAVAYVYFSPPLFLTEITNANSNNEIFLKLTLILLVALTW